jgi:sulfoxide reductase catalytic subunit YedY
MLIKVRPRHPVSSSEITDPEIFRQRRKFLRTGAGAAVAASLAPSLLLNTVAAAAAKLPGIQRGVVTVDEELTSYEDITNYNNFYEFSTDKNRVAELAKNFETRPWQVKISGEINKPVTLDIDDLISKFPLEERIYRFRCVEAWSMVIPWVGFPLAKLINMVEPTSRAKYVEFVTLHDTERMPNQRRTILRWPYVEGLRMDEAMNDLTILGVGLYGETLPAQNGAPLRLVVPWKYGFKNIKSIVEICFTENQPRNTWQISNSREYGFYANVNPEVDHPRWTQSRERRIGEFFKRKTLMFNGYEDEVAHLYASMDLRRNF